MKANWNLIAVALVSGVLGIGLGRFTTPPVSPSDSIEVDDRKTSRSHKSPHTQSQSRFSDATNAKSRLFQHVSKAEFERLARLALESKNELENGAFLHVLFSEWSDKEPMKALAFAQENNRTDLIYEGLRKLGESDSDAALQWITANVKNVTAHGHLTSAVFRGLAKVDPALAVSQAETFKNGPQRDQLLYMTVDEWAKHDIESVFNWLEGQTLSPLISGIHEGVIGRYIEESPRKASELISSMPDGDSKANYASRVTFQLASEDVQSAISWVESMKGSSRNFALMGLVEQWATREDGIKALDYINNSTDLGNRDELLAMASMKLSQNDPEGLESSLSKMSESDQLIAVKQLAQVYSVAMPEKSDQWLSSLAVGPVRDAAIQSSLNAYRKSNISKAFELSESIANDAARINEVHQVMLEWIPVDSKTAIEALQTSKIIPEQQKELMLEQIYKRVEIRDFLLPAE